MPRSTLRVPEITQPLSTGLFIGWGWGMSGVLEGHLSKVDTAHSRNWADHVPYTVEPACKVLGFVQQKLTIQQGFCCLTLQPSIIINNMVIWDLLELTLHPF